MSSKSKIWSNATWNTVHCISNETLLNFLKIVDYKQRESTRCFLKRKSYLDVQKLDVTFFRSSKRQLRFCFDVRNKRAKFVETKSEETERKKDLIGLHQNLT